MAELYANMAIKWWGELQIRNRPPRHPMPISFTSRLTGGARLKGPLSQTGRAPFVLCHCAVKGGGCHRVAKGLPSRCQGLALQPLSRVGVAAAVKGVAFQPLSRGWRSSRCQGGGVAAAVKGLTFQPLSRGGVAAAVKGVAFQPLLRGWRCSRCQGGGVPAAAQGLAPPLEDGVAA